MPPRQPRQPRARPETTVNPGGDFQLAESFGVLVEELEALKNVIENQTLVMERTTSAEARFKVAGLQTQPQFSGERMQMVRQYGQISGLQGDTTAISKWGALSSIQNLQSYGAQQLGSWLAGAPLFANKAPGSPGASGTPVGTPNSTAAPAGSGAQAAAAAGAAVAGGASGGGTGGGGGGGGTPGGGTGPGSGTLTGLPGMIWGPGSRVNPRGLKGLQLVGSRVALSGGTAGGFGAAIRGLPGIGLLADLFEKGTSFYQGQWEQGRYYQEAEGGSILGGEVERLRNLRYSLGMSLSPMGMGGASEAFNAVTQLGFNPAAAGQQQFGGAGPYSQTRQGALNFIYRNFTQSGMPVEQSVKVLEAASQNVSISLGSVTQALKGLSDTAGTAGTNANNARQQFQSYFQTAIGNGAGASSPALAGAVAATQASYGQAFAGTNFAGELSQNRQYLLAGQFGLTPGQIQYVQRTNPGAYLGMIQSQNQSWIQLLGIPQADIQALQQMIQAAGGASAIKLVPDLVNQIAQQWLTTDQWVINNGNTNVWATMLSRLTGISLTPNTVVPWMVQQLAGNGEAANQVTKNPGNPAAGAVSAGAAAAGTSGARTGRYGLAQDFKGNFSGPVYGRFGPINPGQSPMGWQEILTRKSGTAAQAYLSEEKRSGKRSPVLEALLQNLSQGDQVQVQTSTGPRVMSFTDAMKYYPDEMLAGNVMFFNSSGSKVLGSTTQITHGLVAPNSGAQQEEQQAAGSHLGVSEAAWRKTHPGAYSNATMGKGVTVTLSKEAQQLLKLLPSNSDTASAMGTAPSPPWPSISSR